MAKLRGLVWLAAVPGWRALDANGFFSTPGEFLTIERIPDDLAESGYPAKTDPVYNSTPAEFAEGSVDFRNGGATEMDRAKECVPVLLMLLVMSGCCGTQETRYLSWIPRPRDVEARSYNIHDPFPDETAGPNTFTRPRTFMEPRTDTRKDFDLRYLKAANGFPQQRYSALDSPAAARTVRNEAPLWKDPQLRAPITVVPAW